MTPGGRKPRKPWYFRSWKVRAVKVGAERPEGGKGEQHQEREGSGEAKGKENYKVSSKDSSCDFSTRRSLVTRGGMGGSLCDEWELGNWGK